MSQETLQNQTNSVEPHVPCNRENVQRWNIISYQHIHCHSSWILHCRCIQKSQRCLYRWTVLDKIRWCHIHQHLMEERWFLDGKFVQGQSNSYQCTHCHSSWILHCRCIQKSQRYLHRWSVLDRFHLTDIHLHLQWKNSEDSDFNH